MEVRQFSEKLNKVTGNIYTIEEEVTLNDGVYEAELRHDNINTGTLTVYTGPKLTGKKIDAFTLSTPSLAPWKLFIRIYASVPVVYINYETEGDTIEADDINFMQKEITVTQEALNEEAERAIQAEETLNLVIREEESRAIAREQELTTAICDETFRAENAEQKLYDAIQAEQGRAENTESMLSSRIVAEEERAIKKETEIESALTEETKRAVMAEQANASDIYAETVRATNAEESLAESINNEISRSKKVEETNADNLSAEVARAQAAEQFIQNTIDVNKPIWDDKYTRNEIDNLFSAHEMDVYWKKSVPTYADIIKTYPNPKDGWTVNVDDTDMTYRYTGTEWVAISANAIPLADEILDGRMSSSGFRKLKSMEEGANKYIHPSNHDPSIISQNKNNRFVTDTQIAAWDAKQNAMTIDTTMSSSSTNPIQNRAVYAALDGKLDKTGNAVSATKAMQDSDGKQINITYVKKSPTWGDIMGV